MAHPDPGRVGQIAILSTGNEAFEARCSRLDPIFCSPGATRGGGPLADPLLGRGSLLLRGRSERRGIEVEAPAEILLVVDGSPVEGSFEIGVERLRRGVVLILSGRVTLLLHRASVWPQPAEESPLFGASEAISRLRLEIGSVAAHDDPVLIFGETGSGKDLVARAIHEASRRARGPFVVVNVGGTCPKEICAELFGQVARGFNGAAHGIDGALARANGGTLVLDEAAELPLDAQAMLLRFMNQRSIVPLGASASLPLDVRLMAITTADLVRDAAEGRFRASLLHRLAALAVRVPPLCERRDDIGRLIAHFVSREIALTGRPRRLRHRVAAPPWLSAAKVARMVMFDWPGNVRQLANAVRQMVIASGDDAEARLPVDLRAPASDARGFSPPAGAAPGTAGTAAMVLAAVAPAGPEPTSASSALSSGITAKIAATVAAGTAATLVSTRSASRTGPTTGAAPLTPSSLPLPRDVADEELVRVLRCHHWSTAEAARTLGISRTTLYALIDRSPSVRKARDIGAEELTASLRAHRGELRLVAEGLCVSDRALKLRIKELGLRGL